MGLVIIYNDGMVLSLSSKNPSVHEMASVVDTDRDHGFIYPNNNGGVNQVSLSEIQENAT